MIINLSNGEAPVKVPRDLISMGDVRDFFKLSCGRKSQHIMFTLKDRNIKIYKVADEYYCSKSEIFSLGRRQCLSNELLEVIDMIIANPLDTRDISRRLNLSYSTINYRVNRLLHLGLIEHIGFVQKKLNTNRHRYKTYGVKSDLIPLYDKQNKI